MCQVAIQNTIADNLSRSVVDPHNWILNRGVFRNLNSLWGCILVDLFAVRFPNSFPGTSVGAQSPGQSNRCLHSDMGKSQGICQTPLVPNRQVHPADKETEGNNCPHISSLAISAMIFCSSSGQPEDPSSPHDRERTPISRPSPSFGRLAYLRRHYQASGILAIATRLLLALWRPSTNRNYDSAWNVWEQWC